MPRYVISLTPANARRLERWLGGPLEIGPEGHPGAAAITSLDAITDEEFAIVQDRLNNSGPLYHHGGAAFADAAEPPGRHGPAPHQPPV
jgi:hypothetical protein